MADMPVRVVLTATDQLTPALTQAATASDRLATAARQAATATAQIGRTSTGAIATELTAASTAAGRYTTGARQAATATTQIGTATRQAAGSLANLGTTASTASTAAFSMGDAAAAAGLSMGGLVTPATAVAGALAGSVKAAIDWDTAFTGVEKTVSGIDLGHLEGELRGLARSLPQTHAEIAGVAEAAGQLGVAGADITGFTKVMLDMGQATNLTSHEAATSLARISNVMGTMSTQGVDGISRMGATIVALGNTTATTEAEITSMAQRLSGAAATVGMSESSMLGLAAAMSSVGVTAELGGTAMSRAMMAINSAAISGGQRLEQFARVAGTSAEEFAAAWRENPGQAMQMFLAGLGRVAQSGGDLAGTLSDLGLKGAVKLSVFSRLANATDTVAASQKTASQAWADGTALADEAGKRYASAASQIRIAWNQARDTAITFGSALAPLAGQAASVLGGIAQAAGAIPAPILQAAAAIAAMNLASRAMPDLGAKFAGFTAPVQGWLSAVIATRHGVADLAQEAIRSGTSVATMRSVVAGTEPVMGRFAAVMRTTGGAMGLLRGAGSSLLGFLGGPWGLAFAAAGTALSIFAQRSQEAQQRQQQLGSAVSQVAQTVAQSGGAWSAQAQSQLVSLDSTQQLIRDYAQLGYSTETMVQAITHEGDARRTVLAQMDDKIAKLTQEGRLVNASTGMMIQANQAEISQLQEKRDALAQTISTGEQAIAAGQQLADSQQAVGTAAGEAAAGTRESAEAAAEAAKASREAAQASMEYVNSLTGARGAARDFEAAIDAAREAAAKNGRTLDITTAAGRANQQALDAIATSATKSAQALIQAGGSTEKAGQQLERARAGFIDTAVSMGMSRQAASQLADEFGLSASAAGTLAAALEHIPSQTRVTVALDGAAAAQQQASQVQAAITGLPPQVSSIVRVVGAAAGIAQLAGVGRQAQATDRSDPSVQVTTPGAPQATAQLGQVTQAARTADAQSPAVPVTVPGAGAAMGLLDGVTRAAQTLGRQRPSPHVQVTGVAAARAAIGGVMSSLNNLVGRVWTAVVRVATGNADGAVYPPAARSYADGGVARRAERHVAQIAPAGAWRVWAEPETGGEAYIPLARSKRPRSMAILARVAEEFGYQLVKAADGMVAYAQGEVTSAARTITATTTTRLPAAITVPVAAVVTSVTVPGTVPVRTPAGQVTGQGLAAVATSAIQQRFNELTDKEKGKLDPLAAGTIIRATQLTAQYSRQFLRNIETIAGRGYPDVAARLLEMGEDSGAKPAAALAKGTTTQLTQQRAAYAESAKMVQLAKDLAATYTAMLSPSALETATTETTQKTAASQAFLRNIRAIRDRGYPGLALKYLEAGEDEAGQAAAEAAKATTTLLDAATAADRDAATTRADAQALLDELKGVGKVLTIVAGQATSTTPTWGLAVPRPSRQIPAPYTPATRWTPGRSAPLVQVDQIITPDPATTGDSLMTRVGDAVAVTGLDRITI